VSIDTLSHFVDQPAFVARIASLLKPGGALIIGTQNGPVLERWRAVPGPQPGQVRRWVDHRQLRRLLAPYFARVEIESIFPVGDQGLLRVINSVKLNRLACRVIPEGTLERAKERAMLGHTLMAFAQMPGSTHQAAARSTAGG
jgi:2-polyprenyl-3-methyl-5-hydroxy-6-metoxy-1,4-benzoquinol methylase